MRRLRRARPERQDITFRCSRSEMRLVPTYERVQIVGFCLAKAQEKFPELQIYATCQMSNHQHIVGDDKAGVISRFMQYFLSQLAQHTNRLDELRGAVFERRFASIPIVDDDALVERVAYAVTNPVEANLVRSHHEWPGLCLYATTEPQARTFTVFHERRYRKALEAAERNPSRAEVDRDDFYERATLQIPAVSAELAAKIETAVKAREADLQKTQKGVVGIAKVVAASPFARPRLSSRSRMPLCFASTAEGRSAFKMGWLKFVEAFRAASEAFRKGFMTAAFPPWSFRPSTAIG